MIYAQRLLIGVRPIHTFRITLLCVALLYSYVFYTAKFNLTHESFLTFALMTACIWFILFLSFFAHNQINRYLSQFGLIHQLARIRIAVWVAALAIFLFGLVVRQAVFLRSREENSVFSANSVEWLGLAAVIGTLGFLIAMRIRSGQEDDFIINEPVNFAVNKSYVDLLVFLLLLAASIISSVAIGIYSLPYHIPGDSDLYLGISNQLRAGIEPDFDIVTYGYPLVINITRAIYDGIESLLVLQHGLRALVAIIAYLLLRRVSFLIAIVSAFLITSIPMTAYYAHSLLTEGIYGSLVMFTVLATFALILNPDTSGRRGYFLSIGLGVLIGIVSIIRPAGMYIVVPMSFCILVYTRSFRKVLAVGMGLLCAILLLSFGRWFIDGNFVFGADDTDDYYAFPIIRHNLYSPINGPVSKAFKVALNSEICKYGKEIPYSWSDVISSNRARWPRYIALCVNDYNDAMEEELSVADLYIETIRSNPLAWAKGMFNEVQRYITYSDPYLLQAYMWTRIPNMYRYSEVNCEHPYQAKNWVTQEELVDYACAYLPPVDGEVEMLGFIRQVERWTRHSINSIQPYRAISNNIWLRFWAASVLLGVAIIEAHPRIRPLVLVCALTILYHGAVTAFGSYVLPRYLYVIAPCFAIIMGSLYGTILTEMIRAFIAFPIIISKKLTLLKNYA